MLTYEPYTLVFPVRQGEMLLGMKKRGLGTGNWSGFGGKVEKGEGFEQAARRELKEESGIIGKDLKQAGFLFLHYLHTNLHLKAGVFLTYDFNGEYLETDEMKPSWFNISNLPFENMWPDDKLWMPLLLSGKKFEGSFVFRDYDSISEYTLEEML
jgi:8-oxo-dGTP diphosphatase / 2-hydroxy-dATP diphosphatase